MSPKVTYKKDNQLSEALIKARQILDTRGNIPRQYKNMLVFLVPDSDIILTLNGEVRRYLAWQSVVDDKEVGFELGFLASFDLFKSKLHSLLIIASLLTNTPT